MKTSVLLTGVLATTSVLAQTCNNILVPTYQLPTVAAGWQGQLVVTGLKKPRSILVDASGALLVLESGKGLTRITFTDNGGTCLTVAQSKLIINDATVSAPNCSRDPCRLQGCDRRVLWRYRGRSVVMRG